MYTDHEALEPLTKRNRCNKQYSARLTRWLDRLAHFDIAIQHIQHIEESSLKFTDYRSQNPVEGAMPEDKYDEENVISILSEQAKLNLIYGQLFADQSKDSKRPAERKNGKSEKRSENRDDQAQSIRILENRNNVSKAN